MRDGEAGPKAGPDTLHPHRSCAPQASRGVDVRALRRRRMQLRRRVAWAERNRDAECRRLMGLLRELSDVTRELARLAVERL